jgi:hypothetical protein
MEKVWDFLQELQSEFKSEISSFPHSLPEEINLSSGKISKGENYKRLAFMILDYPSFFTRKDILAFRTMFYWGNFISSTFHLQGRFKEAFGKELMESFNDEEEVYFCVNHSPWEYEYKSNNYMLLKDLSKTELQDHFTHEDFIKISIQFPVEQMPNRKEEIKSFLRKGLKVIRTK